MLLTIASNCDSGRMPPAYKGEIEELSQSSTPGRYYIITTIIERIETIVRVPDRRFEEDLEALKSSPMVWKWCNSHHDPD